MCDVNSNCEHILECIKYQRVLYSPLKKKGFVPENGSEVFVRHIPTDNTEYDLLKFFRTVGEVFQIRLMMSENGASNRGFAYVTFFDASTAKKAMTKLGMTPYRTGHYLILESSLNNCRLFIGGIPTYKRKDQVWQELYSKGVKNIIDVIMYRSYSDRAENRGFVFVEFKSHEEAAHFRAKYGKFLRLWDSPVVVDWSVPIPPVDDTVMNAVKIIYLRNLDVCQTREELQTIILNFTTRPTIEKVYKFKNYAFIHLTTREFAEHLIEKLKGHFKNSVVEVTWAKPPSKFTTQDYRHSKVSHLSAQSKSSYKYSSSPPQRSKSICCCSTSFRDFEEDETSGMDSLSRVDSSSSVCTASRGTRSLSPFEAFCTELFDIGKSTPKFSMDKMNTSLRDFAITPRNISFSDLQDATTSGTANFGQSRPCNIALNTSMRSLSPDDSSCRGVSTITSATQSSSKLSPPWVTLSPPDDPLKHLQRNMDDIYGNNSPRDSELSLDSSFTHNISLQDLEVLPRDITLDDIQEIFDLLD